MCHPIHPHLLLSSQTIGDGLTPKEQKLASFVSDLTHSLTLIHTTIHLSLSLKDEEAMEMLYYVVFGGLSMVVAVLELSKSNKDRITTSVSFNSFKNNYLLVYSLMMAGDWLQGPYVYYLYSQYGFGKGEIGRLFIAGFGSSMLFGTIFGSLADKQ
ncbi:hypothetical protein GIB67_000928 [Kingdonia uniflora]|uniref:Molybdate-anion transporter n=1 Tax=Kingdonia uniflora TaxID=39325 RepID=A0A7J7MFK8_9MAGN|nr:hypothetical protein GIB67_000928 [Kingdonia uniflora]